MIVCYDDYTYAYWSMIYAIIIFSPIIIITICGIPYSIYKALCSRTKK